MHAEARRQAILDILRDTCKPVSAGTLAARFSVSRQIIVGDIALLRAGGAEISATPQGYTMVRAGKGILRRIACQHSGEEMEAELNAIVDQGCTVVDVIVEHPIYGQLTGTLQLASRYDVGQFIQRCTHSDARPLSDLTGGIHLHTLSCPDEEAFVRVREALHQLGVLVGE